MGYMALYRKWRPNDFDEVRGQDAIVQTLRNQIIYNRIGHAYLFCGTRGTGKTSIAKLFAKAVNCEHPVNGNPCNACPSCQAINAQSSLDVLEIDAASNNGVENIRDIREQVQYSPVEGRYKVYIIDEVHMLSSGAFNALLKTLEEPPSYVIFILATTEKHKIPVTILSRCQKYDFKRISVDTITGHLVSLMEKEQIDAEEKALRYIARAADGSMRDALSLLDQCIAFYLGQTLTYENVLEVLGTADTSVFSTLLRSILKKDSMSALDIIDTMITEGRELSQFLSDFLWYLRNLLILKDQEGAEESLDMSKETIATLKEECAMVDTTALLRYIRLLSELSNQIRTATQKRVLLEVGFIKLCRPETESDAESLSERVRQLETMLAQGLPVIPAGGTWNNSGINPSSDTAIGGAANGGVSAGNSASQSQAAQISPEEALEKRFSPAEAEDLKKIANRWNDIVNQSSMPMQQFLRAARVAVADNSTILQLVFSNNSLAKEYFEREHHKNLDLLSELVAEQTGKVVTFKCTSDSHQPAEQSNYIDLSKIHQTVIFE
ncbi:DNA-directed DNA polymerase [Anaerobutyricum hallii]|uniref:DNA-directed DNA polymerase n=1 Tax=Anaerobutyricum hallii TaxID=39488 RepID=A0A285PVW1_9FIRM|nr:DNA-directed DNA polymerase [Anaerobutyricum hallii]